MARPSSAASDTGQRKIEIVFMRIELSCRSTNPPASRMKRLPGADSGKRNGRRSTDGHVSQPRVQSGEDCQETKEGARIGSAARKENCQPRETSGGAVPGGEGPQCAWSAEVGSAALRTVAISHGRRGSASGLAGETLPDETRHRPSAASWLSASCSCEPDESASCRCSPWSSCEWMTWMTPACWSSAWEEAGNQRATSISVTMVFSLRTLEWNGFGWLTARRFFGGCGAEREEHAEA